MSKAGFTVIELIMVVVLIGLISMIGIPRVRDGVQKQGVRSARLAATTLVAKARAAAVQRGCATTLEVQPDGRIWVTACRTDNVAGTDTLGGIEDLAGRFNVTVTPSQTSLTFTPRGITTGGTMRIQFQSSTARDSIMINRVGKVVRG